ncbi:MAG: MOSC domain-containing protein [Pseudomonadota bacterium]|nr:MOSC domain-containing protein [Pseudomonadota bacterium]MDQ7999227.1 MOSC domain-containing protein [Pseudomonadota bacterium]MDQ8019490.1 MOSC domain-containing protein [Pseudomonadota bacterium]
MPVAQVVAVHASPTHGFSKQAQPAVRLQLGLGVAGDAHAGTTVQHRSRVARNPSQPNLRQVHLLQVELFDMLAERGFVVRPGDLGENLTTRGIDLLALPAGTRLRLGAAAEVELTGLRNPCVQIDRFQRGLRAAVLDRDAAGALIRKAGVMAVVTAEGEIRPGDAVALVLPALPHRSLEPV